METWHECACFVRGRGDGYFTQARAYRACQLPLAQGFGTCAKLLKLAHAYRGTMICAKTVAATDGF
jgi:hypothetical protein